MNKPTIARKEPIVVGVEAGQTYHWCACGKSAKQPFCDGSHENTDFTPLPFAAKKTETVYLCACKQTDTASFCDASYTKLPS